MALPMLRTTPDNSGSPESEYEPLDLARTIVNSCNITLTNLWEPSDNDVLKRNINVRFDQDTCYVSPFTFASVDRDKCG